MKSDGSARYHKMPSRSQDSIGEGIYVVESLNNKADDIFVYGFI